MGRRLLVVSVAHLVALCKVGDGQEHWARVTENPLPEDARCVGIEWPQGEYDQCARLVIESETYWGDSHMELPPPQFVTTYRVPAPTPAEPEKEPEEPPKAHARHHKAEDAPDGAGGT